jgi:hypothetical protein
MKLRAHEIIQNYPPLSTIRVFILNFLNNYKISRLFFGAAGPSFYSRNSLRRMMPIQDSAAVYPVRLVYRAGLFWSEDSFHHDRDGRRDWISQQVLPVLRYCEIRSQWSFRFFNANLTPRPKLDNKLSIVFWSICLYASTAISESTSGYGAPPISCRMIE